MKKNEIDFVCKFCSFNECYIVDDVFCVCKKCGSENRTMNFNLSYLERCEYRKNIFYKRINYVNEIILGINNCSMNNIENINDIKTFLENNELIVNFKNIKTAGKNIKIHLGYKQIHFIINYLLNHNQIIKDFMKEKTLHLFIEFEKYYNKNKIKNRKKLIGYTFILHKIFKKLNYVELLIYLNYPMMGRHEETKKIYKEKYKKFFQNI